MPLAELPQTNKQHAVPQNIMDVEFKLIGDLTMRQFAYLIVFGGMSYFSSVVVLGAFKYPLVILFAVLGFGLAFVPIQDRGLDEWIANFLRAVYGPTQRVWRKEATIPSAFLYENINVVKQEMIALAPTSSRRKLEEYLHYQVSDTTVDPLDIPEAEYAKKARDAFAYSVPEPTTHVPILPSVGVTLEPELPSEPEMPGEIPSEEPKTSEEQNQQPTPSTEALQQPQQAPQSVAPQPAVQVQEPIFKQPRPNNNMTFSPITPDMHAGRRFTNLLPDGGEIILPIRGEKVLITSDEQEIEEEVQEKAEKLKKLLAQIKGNPNIKISQNYDGLDQPIPQPAAPSQPAASTAKTEEVVSTEAEQIVEKLKQETDSLSSEIEKLKAEQTNESDQKAISEKEQRIKMLEDQKTKTQADYSRLAQQILDLQNKLKQKEEVTGVPVTVGSSRPVYAKIQPISMVPNVVTGIVKKPDGGILEGVLLIIQNDKGEAVRAFKTNSVGQFSLTTALANGIYTLEVSDDKGANLAFDIISIEAKGEVIPPIEILGREKTN